MYAACMYIYLLNLLSSQNREIGPFMVTVQRTTMVAPPDQFELPKSVQLGPLLTRGDHFWQPKSVQEIALGRTDFHVTV